MRTKAVAMVLPYEYQAFGDLEKLIQGVKFQLKGHLQIGMILTCLDIERSGSVNQFGIA